MKVFINNRDLLTWPRAMATKLIAEGHEIIFIDNGSSHEALQDWYDEETNRGNIRVIRCRNLGPYAPWQVAFDEMQDDYFAVTDPDLDISTVPADWPEKMIAGVLAFDQKCGLSLLDDSVPSLNPAWIDDGFQHYPFGGSPYSWGEILPFVYKSTLYHKRPVDTTFAVYPPGAKHVINGTRISAPYAARHLPWHVVPNLTGDERTIEILLDDEYRHYLKNAIAGVCTGSITAIRFREKGLI